MKIIVIAKTKAKVETVERIGQPTLHFESISELAVEWTHFFVRYSCIV